MSKKLRPCYRVFYSVNQEIDTQMRIRIIPSRVYAIKRLYSKLGVESCKLVYQTFELKYLLVVTALWHLNSY